MNIVVTGATSFVGTGAVKELLDRGHCVFAVLRENSAKADKLLQNGKIPENLTILEEELGNLGSDIDKKLAVKPAVPKKAVSPKSLRLGDTVRVLSMNLKGTVSSLPNAKGDLYVQMGILRSLVNIKDLELVDEKTISGPGIPQSGPRSSGNKNGSGSSKIKMSKSFSISPEINLIGMTVDEAVTQACCRTINSTRHYVRICTRQKIDFTARLVFQGILC